MLSENYLNLNSSSRNTGLDNTGVLLGEKSSCSNFFENLSNNKFGILQSSAFVLGAVSWTVMAVQSEDPGLVMAGVFFSLISLSYLNSSLFTDNEPDDGINPVSNDMTKQQIVNSMLQFAGASIAITHSYDVDKGVTGNLLSIAPGTAFLISSLVEVLSKDLGNDKIDFSESSNSLVHLLNFLGACALIADTYEKGGIEKFHAPLPALEHSGFLLSTSMGLYQSSGKQAIDFVKEKSFSACSSVKGAFLGLCASKNKGNENLEQSLA